MQRRVFLKTMLPAAAAVTQAGAQTDLPWGGRVLDTHLHLRQDPESCLTHMKGCGVTHAVLLTRVADQEKAKTAMEKHPRLFARSVSLDPALPDAATMLRTALTGGAISIGELKNHLALSSPEMKRVYDIAAELQVPVMIHIQTFPHYPGEQPYGTGYTEFDKVLRAHPHTNFIGHADLFWANISADVPTDRGYPNGRVKPGGLTDKWLADFPNLYADMSANSGNNGLSRDPDFSRGFIARHKTKLIFGSDCSCSDGKGAGVSQNRNPEAARLAGKCVARETLTLLQRLASPEVFRQVTWENGVRLFRFAA